MFNSLWPHEPQHARPPCPSPTPGVHPNPCPLSWWCHPTISSSVVPFFSCHHYFPASRSFPMSQLFTSGSQSTGISTSTSVLPKNSQDWSLLGWTGWISLQSKGSQESSPIPTNRRRNQKINKNLHRNEWKWKHNNPKPVGHGKSSPKGKVHSNTGIPEETRKVK